MIDKSWNDAASKIKPKNKNAFQSLRRFNISREKFSETSSQSKFAQIAKQFDKDKLKFFLMICIILLEIIYLQHFQNI